jgi:hypothetical protein
VNNGRCLQGLAWLFLRHARRRETAEFLINQRQQFLGSPAFATSNGLQHLRDLAHGSRKSYTVIQLQLKVDCEFGP